MTICVKKFVFFNNGKAVHLLTKKQKTSASKGEG
jgi:hypothetical protein